MRIQMINSVHLDTTGSRLTYNGGELYIVDNTLAAELISAGDAFDPENPPVAPVVEDTPVEEQPTDEVVTTEVTE